MLSYCLTCREKTVRQNPKVIKAKKTKSNGHIKLMWFVASKIKIY